MNYPKEQEILQLLNDRRTGLRDSSDTNKARYNILALIENIESEAKIQERYYIRRKIDEQKVSGRITQILKNRILKTIDKLP